MRKQQKIILTNIIIVIIITTLAVTAMINLKDWINRSEAIRAMNHLGHVVLQYRQNHGSVPSESHVNSIRDNLPGNVRLGEIKYRARWIKFNAKPNEILAYTEKKYPSSFLSNGFILLRLNGTVEWMEKQEFQVLLEKQQDPLEIHMLK